MIGSVAGGHGKGTALTTKICVEGAVGKSGFPDAAATQEQPLFGVILNRKEYKTLSGVKSGQTTHIKAE